MHDSLENEYLFTKDVYNVYLNAEMVTLSACETGIGELKKGEGVISVARSFSYAGAGAINTTLWKVVDDKALRIMELFYKSIWNGETKDVALQKAKIAYLSENDDLDNHPFFWAPFIPIGDMQMIGMGGTYFKWWWGVLFLIGLFFFFGRQRKKAI